MAAQELQDALASYDPGSMRQMVRDLPVLGAALGQVGQGVRAVADRAEQQWPTAGPVTEGLHSMARDLKAAAQTAGVADAFGTHHGTDIERHDAPRGGSRAAESRWDVGRADDEPVRAGRQRTTGSEPDTSCGRGRAVESTVGTTTSSGGRHRAPDTTPAAAISTSAPSGGIALNIKNVPDPLKVAGRLVLGPGEKFAGSGLVRNDYSGAMVLAAGVDTPAGRQVHVGVVYDEDRRHWRGAHAPARDTVVDEDGDECRVDTGAGATAVLEAADAARLPEMVEDVIARAAAVDKRCQQLNRECDRLHGERVRLEAQRFGDPAAGEQRIRAGDRVEHELHYQGRRRRDVDRAVDRLGPDDRAVYDRRQQQIDAAGQDGWEPGKEAEAAEVCGLTVPRFREMTRLARIPYLQRTREQETQLDALAHGGGDSLHPVLPPLLAEQAALVCGLTVDEYRELERLDRIPKPNPLSPGQRSRTDAEQARLDALEASPRGATGATPRETAKLRDSYRQMLRVHHSAKTDVGHAWEDLAAMEAAARPLDPAAAADLQRVTAELAEANHAYEQMAGSPSATVELPARNGGALLIQAVQREDSPGVDYRVDRKPADADDGWSPGGLGDPYSTTAAGVRKIAKLIAGLAGH